MSVKIDKGSALDSLSMTPLIDVIFLLLIFFLVATKFAEEERAVPVELAEASEAMPLTSTPKEVIINIDQQGQYFVTGEIKTLDELTAILERARINNPGRASAVIRADKRAAHSCSHLGNGWLVDTSACPPPAIQWHLPPRRVRPILAAAHASTVRRSADLISDWPIGCVA